MTMNVQKFGLGPVVNVAHMSADQSYEATVVIDGEQDWTFRRSLMKERDKSFVHVYHDTSVADLAYGAEAVDALRKLGPSTYNIVAYGKAVLPALGLYLLLKPRCLVLVDPKPCDDGMTAWMQLINQRADDIAAVSTIKLISNGESPFSVTISDWLTVAAPATRELALKSIAPLTHKILKSPAYAAVDWAAPS